MQSRVQQVLKILGNDFGVFLFLREKFRFFKQTPTASRVNLKNVFSKKKIVRKIKKPSLPKFQLSKFYRCEMGPETKKGEPNNEKCVRGSVGC